MVSFKFIGSHSVTRGNRYKLTQKQVHYNLTKFLFFNRVVPIWNSLPDYVASACLVKVFEIRLDNFWRDQECLREWKASLSGIGSRSTIIKMRTLRTTLSAIRRCCCVVGRCGCFAG